jgi:hypothetical protein
MMRIWAESERSRGIAEYFEILDNARTSLIEEIDYFDALYNLAMANSGIVEIPLIGDPAALGVPLTVEMGGTGLPGGMDPVDIPGSPYITPDFADRNPLKSDMVIVVRIADDMANPDDIRSLEFLMASTSRVPEKLARKAASSLGGNGGYISAIEEVAGTCSASCEELIRGAYNDWEIRADSFAGTSWYGTVSANPASATNGAYLVSYTHVTEDEVAGDYLYRVPYTTMPELNRMGQTARLNGNNIVGADNIYASYRTHAGSGGVLSVQGSAYINTLHVSSQLVVENDVRLGDLYMWSYVESHPSLDTGQNQNIIVEGELYSSGSSITLGPTEASVTADIINAGNVIANSSQANNMAAAGSTAADSVTGTGTLSPAILNVPSLDASSASITSLNATDVTTTDFQNTGTFSTNTATISGSVNISRLTSCLSGCVY